MPEQKRKVTNQPREWILEFNGKKLGPYTLEELTQMLRDGHISPTDRVTKDPSSRNWILLKDALDPEYWSDFEEEHTGTVEDLFDVLQAFKERENRATPTTPNQTVERNTSSFSKEMQRAGMKPSDYETEFTSTQRGRAFKRDYLLPLLVFILAVLTIWGWSMALFSEKQKNQVKPEKVAETAPSKPTVEPVLNRKPAGFNGNSVPNRAPAARPFAPSPPPPPQEPQNEPEPPPEENRNDQVEDNREDNPPPERESPRRRRDADRDSEDEGSEDEGENAEPERID